MAVERLCDELIGNRHQAKWLLHSSPISRAHLGVLGYSRMHTHIHARMHTQEWPVYPHMQGIPETDCLVVWMSGIVVQSHTRQAGGQVRPSKCQCFKQLQRKVMVTKDISEKLSHHINYCDSHSMGYHRPMFYGLSQTTGNR